MRVRCALQAVGSILKSRGTSCGDAAGDVACSCRLAKLSPAFQVPLCCKGALRMAHGRAGGFASGLTWGRGGTEPTRCRCDEQQGRAKCSVGPTRKRQEREVAGEAQGRVLLGGEVADLRCCQVSDHERSNACFRPTRCPPDQERAFMPHGVQGR